MRRPRWARVLASAVVIVLVVPARAALAFDTWWHAEATRRGVAANGFSADARLATQVTNYLTDFHTVAADKIGGFEGLFRRMPGGPPRNAPTTARLDPQDMGTGCTSTRCLRPRRSRRSGRRSRPTRRRRCASTPPIPR